MRAKRAENFEGISCSFKGKTAKKGPKTIARIDKIFWNLEITLPRINIWEIFGNNSTVVTH